MFFQDVHNLNMHTPKEEKNCLIKLFIFNLTLLIRFIDSSSWKCKIIIHYSLVRNNYPDENV